jgi:hypothetical protein
MAVQKVSFSTFSLSFWVLETHFSQSLFFKVEKEKLLIDIWLWPHQFPQVGDNNHGKQSLER